MPLSRRTFLWTVAAAAQQPTFSSEVKVVNVLATVRTRKGEIVRSLTKDDFVLQEDTRTQAIKYFSQESDLPLTLGLLVDTSMSQRRVLGEEQTASYRFLDKVLREDKDNAFLIHFDVEVELIQDLTSSKKDLQKGLETLRTPELRRRNPDNDPGGFPGPGQGRGRGGRGGGFGVGTALYDSVLLASEELMERQKGRKALIMLSDGVDMGSRVTLQRAIEAAQRTDTLVYALLFADKDFQGGGFPGLGGGRGGRRGGGGGMPQGERPNGKKVLEQLARETGGGFFEVSKKLSLDQIYAQIQEELRNQYSIGYTPDRWETGFHKIELSTRKKDLIVQARAGYYAK